MSFTVATYTCIENTYCEPNGDIILGEEDQLVTLCNKDPGCVGYYYPCLSQ